MSGKVSSTDSAKFIKKIDNGEVVVNKKCGNDKKGENKGQKTKSNPKSFEVETNKLGDVLFKKAMKESALKYAKIKSLQELRMTFKRRANSYDGGQLTTFPFSVERAKASGWAVFGISGSGKSNAGFSLAPLFPYLPLHRLLVFAGTNSLPQTVQNH